MPDEEWTQCKLGDLFQVSNERLGSYDDENEPPILSLSKYEGVVLSEKYFRRRVASRNLASYKLLRPGEFAYSTIHVDEGSIGANRLGVVGVLSPMYTTMHLACSRIDDRWIELLLRRPFMLSNYRAKAAGTVHRRRSLPFAAFADIGISVPSLAVQRRHVSLVEALDESQAAAKNVADLARQSLDARLDEIWKEPFGPTLALGDIAEFRSGPSWGARQEKSEPVAGATPVIKITNTRPDGSVDMTEKVWVRELPASTRLLMPSSLLMIRTNGNRSRVGNVYRTTREMVDHAYSAFQIGIFPRQSFEATHLYWALSAPSCQAKISGAASGSTGLSNISLTWLRRLLIPWPPTASREELVTTAEAISDAAFAASREARALSTAKEALLNSLFKAAARIN